MAKPKNNVYDPIYISKRENITLDEAKIFIENYKKNKATNKQNFIKKHGEELGLKLYGQWIDKSLGKGHKLEGKYKSLYCKEFYVKNGYTEEESIRLAKEAQYKNSSLHIDYYLNRGFTLEQAKKKIKNIHAKKKDRNYLLESLILLHPNKNIEELLEMQRNIRDSSSKEKLGEEKFNLKNNKMRKTLENNGAWVPLSEKTEYEFYSYMVWFYTNSNDLKGLENYDKRGRAGVDGAFHLDHKFSISAGFVQNIPPELIGSINNLVFLPWEENVKKQGNCSITKEDLINED